MNGTELDEDTLATAAKECLTRPSDVGAFDDRWWTTHGPVAGWADRGDDVRAESNYLTMERLTREAAGDDADAHVIDASFGHWAVGSVRHLMVQVYMDPDDPAAGYTAAFREATALAQSLHEYPILDESDYSDREYAAWQEWHGHVLAGIQRREFDDDTEEDHAGIMACYTSDDLADSEGPRGSVSEDVSPNGYTSDDIREELVRERYVVARNAYYTLRGGAMLS